MGVRAVRLEVVAGNAAGMSILVVDELVIGRRTAGAGRLADDREISRSHARIALDANGLCTIEDLGSTNGTFINGLRISAAQTLSVGDTIKLGASTLVVRDLPEAEPPEASGEAVAGALASVPSLSLRVDFDLDSKEAWLHFDGAPEPVRLVLQAGVWRFGQASENQKAGYL
jgi:pSer/pThr/pTyr-binding forkhead associated (FHA) protein